MYYILTTINWGKWRHVFQWTGNKDLQKPSASIFVVDHYGSRQFKPCSQQPDTNPLSLASGTQYLHLYYMSLWPILVISYHLFLRSPSSLFKRLYTYYSTRNNNLYIIFVYLKASTNNLKWERGGIVLHTINLGTRMRWVLSFTPPHPGGGGGEGLSSYRPNRRPGGLHIRPAHLGEKQK